MVLSGRSDDPKLEQLARAVFAMFPQCHRCGQTIERFEDADVRVHVQRVVHRGAVSVAAERRARAAADDGALTQGADQASPRNAEREATGFPDTSR